MKRHANPSTISRCLSAALLLAAADTVAQTCAAPLAIAPNTPYFIDTCLADSSLVLACQMFALLGPAGIVRLNLPYPAGTLVVTPMTVDYDPALFLQQWQCGNSAWCGAAVDDVFQGGTESMDLSGVDSGEYFLAISTWYDPGAAPCGRVTVSYNLTPEQQALVNDGVFRGGTSAVPDP